MTSSLKTMASWMTRVLGRSWKPEAGRMIDRRRSTRFLDGQGTIVTIINDMRERSASGRIADVTETGVRVWCDERMNVGDVVRCSLQFGRLAQVAQFRVVWRRRDENGYEYGFQCPEGGYSRAFLRDYVTFLLTGKAERKPRIQAA